MPTGGKGGPLRHRFEAGSTQGLVHPEEDCWEKWGGGQPHLWEVGRSMEVEGRGEERRRQGKRREETGENRNSRDEKDHMSSKKKVLIYFFKLSF